MTTTAQVLDALRPVQDPEIGKSLVDLGMIRGVEVTPAPTPGDGAAVRVSFEVVLTTPACPLKSVIQADCEKAVKALPHVASVAVRFGADVKRAAQGIGGKPQMAPGVKNIILVGAGKGGVGKSTAAVNLAVALAQDGATVGILDADVYGPSLPIMLGLKEQPVVNAAKKIVPLVAHGVKVLSAGSIIEPGQAVIWRGPMLNNLLLQFLAQAEWGELDYLIVDLPPGTGDVQITLSQHIQATGAVLVATPQDVALADVLRAKDMFDKVKIPVLGLVENMSLFVCDSCGAVHAIFATGGAEKAAKGMGIPFLGKLPIDAHIRESGDAGKPYVVAHADSPGAVAFREAARRLAGQVSLRAQDASGAGPAIRLI